MALNFYFPSYVFASIHHGLNTIVSGGSRGMFSKYKYGKKGGKFILTSKSFFRCEKFDCKAFFQVPNFFFRMSSPLKLAFSFLYTPNNAREFICFLRHTRGCVLCFSGTVFSFIPSVATVHHFFRPRQF